MRISEIRDYIREIGSSIAYSAIPLFLPKPFVSKYRGTAQYYNVELVIVSEEVRRKYL
jgi:hypothetical protein